MLSPLSFTPEFHKKMAELPKAERQEWLESLVSRLGRATTSDAYPLEQELREVARGCRLDLVANIEKQLGPFDPLHLRAVLEVPREHFVRPEDLARSAEDTPLPLDDEGHATISAPHAYLLSFRLLQLGPGDGLIELGTGTGYGAALASYIVGGEGWVVTIEIDERLHALARTLLASHKNVRAELGDAIKIGDSGRTAKKMVATFAVDDLPDAWLDMLPEGGVLVAPVGARDKDQKLVRITKKDGELLGSEHGAVRYVKNRSPG